MSKRKKKKNRNLGPRRKRMRRPARLIAAVKWRSWYGGKNPVRGYTRWFGVDPICAITELRMLGVAVDPEYEAQLRRTIAPRAGWRHGDAPRSSPPRHGPSRSNGPTIGPSSGSPQRMTLTPFSTIFRSDLDDFAPTPTCR